jgi:hypothetical protein
MPGTSSIVGNGRRMTKEAMDIPMSEEPESTQARSGSPFAYRTFSRGLPVNLIATPRSAFMTCHAGDTMNDVVAKNVEKYDSLPVIEMRNDGAERIVGLVRLDPFHNAPAPAKPVSEFLQPLNEAMLIGSDASIISFIRRADDHGCRLVVSGSEISGLVALSDLQKLPVRAALFAIITQLEMTMSQALSKEYEDEESWLKQLTSGREEKLRQEIAKARSEDSFVNSLLFTQFADKVFLLGKCSRLPPPKAAFQKELKRIQTLRDSLAHANNYAETPADAVDTCRTVRLIDKWIEIFSEWQ